MLLYYFAELLIHISMTILSVLKVSAIHSLKYPYCRSIL